MLDHILLSPSLSAYEYDVVQVNSEFTDQVSDHDPQVVRPTLWPAQVSRPLPDRPILERVTQGLSPRLASVVDALPFSPHSRVLEIGCGPGAAARAIAGRLETGHILAIDRSATAVAQARAGSYREIASGRMSVRQAEAESFVLEPDDLPFDIVFAVRVGALDGRHPDAGQRAMARIAAALAPRGRVFVSGGEALRELDIPPVRGSR